MQTYSGKIRLGGSVLNEVRRSGMLAFEVMLMKIIHGDDAVSEVRTDGEEKITQEEARARIMRDYVERSPDVAKVFSQMFPQIAMGVAELPVKLPSITLAEPEVKRPAKAGTDPLS